MPSWTKYLPSALPRAFLGCESLSPLRVDAYLLATLTLWITRHLSPGRHSKQSSRPCARQPNALYLMGELLEEEAVCSKRRAVQPQACFVEGSRERNGSVTGTGAGTCSLQQQGFLRRNPVKGVRQPSHCDLDTLTPRNGERILSCPRTPLVSLLRHSLDGKDICKLTRRPWVWSCHVSNVLLQVTRRLERNACEHVMLNTSVTISCPDSSVIRTVLDQPLAKTKNIFVPIVV